MEKFIKLSEFSDKINEENLSGLANAHPWEEIVKVGTKLVNGVPVQLTANLFGTGIDKIDVTSKPFQDAVQLLRWLYTQVYEFNGREGLDGNTLLIRGSASAVGSSSGYDNFALATRRANNLIAALKEWFNKNRPKTELENSTIPSVDLDWGSLTKYLKIKQDAVVGRSTKRDSAEAKAEQCVYLIWVPFQKQIDFKYDLIQPIDNVGTIINPKKPIILIPDPNPIQIDGDFVRCGCCGREFTDNDRKSWVIKRYQWSLNELLNGWLKDRNGLTVWEWLTNMSKK